MSLSEIRGYCGCTVTRRWSVSVLQCELGWLTRLSCGDVDDAVLWRSVLISKRWRYDLVGERLSLLLEFPFSCVCLDCKSLESVQYIFNVFEKRGCIYLIKNTLKTDNIFTISIFIIIMSSVSHDPSEIILIWWFTAQETWLSVLKTVAYFCVFAY